MQIEIVAIGDEILRGTTLNSNASFISHKLFEKGYRVSRHTVLSDEEGPLEKGLKEALARSPLVICTGGLGPTCDDHTRAIAARLFHSDFSFREDVAEDLKKRFGEHLLSLKDQATAPSKALLLLNQVGTAPGLIFSTDQGTLILMPGVPPEMQQMFTGDVLPYLERRFPPAGKRICRQVHFCLLIENLVDPVLRQLQGQFPTVEVGIYPAFGSLAVSLSSTQRDPLEKFYEGLVRQFDPYIFHAPSGKIEEAVHAWFVQEKKTLALAESCTGGLMAAELTSLAGASDYFLGSLVVYSNTMKSRFLGVREETLRAKGAVSKEVVEEMLAGVFERTEADFAIAISGIAGPTGGSVEKPVGTMWAALGERGKPADVGTFLTKGNRQTRITSATHYLLGALWRKVVKKIPAFPFF